MLEGTVCNTAKANLGSVFFKSQLRSPPKNVAKAQRSALSSNSIPLHSFDCINPTAAN